MCPCPLTPFTSLSQVEKCLGFLSNTNFYHHNFEYITQSLNLTRPDTYVTLTSTVSPKDRECIWRAARAHANMTCTQDRSHNTVGCSVSSIHPSSLKSNPIQMISTNKALWLFALQQEGVTLRQAGRWQPLGWPILRKPKQLSRESMKIQPSISLTYCA